MRLTNTLIYIKKLALSKLLKILRSDYNEKISFVTYFAYFGNFNFCHFDNRLYIAFYTSYKDRNYADVKQVR